MRAWPSERRTPLACSSSTSAIGYPGLVLLGKPAAEPYYLDDGWVGFDYSAAFERPVKLINDAAMQAIGSYRGGRMLFLGLGTGLGAATTLSRSSAACGSGVPANS